MHSDLPGDTVMAAGALDGNVGTTTKVRVEGADLSVAAEVVGAEVDDDGRGFTITLELPDGVVPVLDSLPGIDWRIA